MPNEHDVTMMEKLALLIIIIIIVLIHIINNNTKIELILPNAVGSVPSDRPEDKSYPRLPPNVTSVSQDTCKLYFFIPSFYSFLFFRVLFISFSKLYNSKLRDEKSFFFETGAYTQQVFELIQGITSVLNEPCSVIFGRLPPIPLCTITSTSFKHILMSHPKLVQFHFDFLLKKN